MHPGDSVLQYVTATEEWCAEAYMETDYSKIERSDFERTVRDYAVYRVIGAEQNDSNTLENLEVSL